MSAEGQTIPEDIMPTDVLIASEKVLDSILCLDPMADGGTEGVRASAIDTIAKAIRAERFRNAQPRRKIIEALCELPHSIEHAKVEIRFNPHRPGNNALNQLITQLEARFGASHEEA